MIAIDTNVLVRYLVDDDPGQAEVARTLLAELTSERQGFICREVIVELSWVLDRAYGFSRDQVSSVIQELAATEELSVEAADDVVRAAEECRQGGTGFSDRMIAAAARRSGATAIYTFDRRAARLSEVTLLAD